MKKAVAFLMLIIIVSCSTAKHSFLDYKLEKGEYYFPLDKETRNTDINVKLGTFTNKWYSEHLYTLKEPILYKNINEKVEIYRFTKLGTWEKPYSIRIERKGSSIIITKKKTNGKGGYEKGHLIINKKKTVSLEKWNVLASELKITDFWNIKTHQDNFINDGAEWILEGFKNGKYHFVVRTSPDIEVFKEPSMKELKNPEFANLCNLIENMMHK